MRHQRQRRDLAVDTLPTLPAELRAQPVVRAHANPVRAARHIDLARDDRHLARRVLHDVERGVDPDEL